MGLEHSQPRPARPRPLSTAEGEVVILRSDIPEAYLLVDISDDVVKRVEALTKLQTSSSSEHETTVGGLSGDMTSEKLR